METRGNVLVHPRWSGCGGSHLERRENGVYYQLGEEAEPDRAIPT